MMCYCEDHDYKPHACMQAFHDLTYARSDNRIIDIPINEIGRIHKGCELVFYKILMIRLRRRYNLNEWNMFRQFTDTNITFITENFSLRWLLSVVDTYADCGNDIEKSNAMLIDSFFTFEKLRAGEKGLYDFVERQKKIMCMPVFDGASLNSVNMEQGDDTLVNYFHRIFNVLETTPTLLTIYKTYMESAWKHDSHFSTLSPHYIYIKSGYDDGIRKYQD